MGRFEGPPAKGWAPTAEPWARGPGAGRKVTVGPQKPGFAKIKSRGRKRKPGDQTVARSVKERRRPSPAGGRRLPAEKGGGDLATPAPCLKAAAPQRGRAWGPKRPVAKRAGAAILGPRPGATAAGRLEQGLEPDSTRARARLAEARASAKTPSIFPWRPGEVSLRRPPGPTPTAATPPPPPPAPAKIRPPPPAASPRAPQRTGPPKLQSVWAAEAQRG